MSLGRRNTPPRHLAGAPREPWTSRPADFDVDAAFEPDFDFDALFAADDLPPEEAKPKARVARRHIAIALAATLAALPLLFLDNFQATASPGAKVDASRAHTTLSPTGPPLVDEIPTTEAPTTTAPLPQPVVFQAASTTSSTPSTVAPTTTVPAPTTTTTAKPKVIASKPTVIVTTTTTTAPPRTTTTAAAPAAPAVTASHSPDPNAESTWDALARCESGGNWAANTGNGYYGGLQFSLSTWQGLGGTGYPYQASKDTQIAIGKKLYARSGWSAWPGCSRQLGWT